MALPPEILSRTPLSTITNNCSSTPLTSPKMHITPEMAREMKSSFYKQQQKQQQKQRRICLNRPTSLKKLAVQMDIDEAIEHAEKFYRWIEQGNEPGVTPMQILQIAAIVNELKCHRDQLMSSEK
ncbi:hypothetical protein QAD02_015730 [Eretmocerus hayati]|uniref:Uncharacterized protein n=1 Tax=Eretmocerus hayati TaxID=131215 RepID=A0ACC2P947_9HYME|nr:hypothetical protein QAD02_015730 [Eretmocerus hayati]